MTFPHEHVLIRATRRLGTVLDSIAMERQAQHRKWGRQILPNGTSDTEYSRGVRDSYRAWVDSLPTWWRPLTWLDVLQEEFLEVSCEEDPVKLRAELVQVAAVATAWIEALDAGEVPPYNPANHDPLYARYPL